MTNKCKQFQIFLPLDGKFFMTTFITLVFSFSTATGVLVTPKHFFMMNIGDSRSVVCRKSEVFFATDDHKPTHYSERMRIEKAGGHVSQNRVNGQLAVSRALGDFEMKRNSTCDQISQLVSPEADITGKVTRIKKCNSYDSYRMIVLVTWISSGQDRRNR